MPLSGTPATERDVYKGIPDPAKRTAAKEWAPTSIDTAALNRDLDAAAALLSKRAGEVRNNVEDIAPMVLAGSDGNAEERQ